MSTVTLTRLSFYLFSSAIAASAANINYYHYCYYYNKLAVLCSSGPVLLSLSHASIQSVVRQHYIKSVSSDQASRLHRLLAGKFLCIIFANISIFFLSARDFTTNEDC